MLRKPWRVIVESEKATYKTAIYGNNHEIEIEMGHTPDYNGACETPSFKYKGYRYFLNEFMRTENHEFFDGITHDTAWSGVGIKLSQCCDTVKAYTVLTESNT